MMVATCQEVLEQEDHEARLRDDPEYALQCRTETVYGDLREFEQFLDDFQLVPQIARELLRALCEIDPAIQSYFYGSYVGTTMEEITAIKHKDANITLSRRVVLQAVKRIKDEVDAKIRYALEQGK